MVLLRSELVQEKCVALFVGPRRQSKLVGASAAINFHEKSVILRCNRTKRDG
jgi:hypothetical protein